MKRYMKNNKFDFFQSPHPRTKDFYNLVKDKDCLPSDSENNDLHIFQTPVRLSSFSPFSPLLQNDYCSSQMTANKKGYYDGLFLENIQDNQSSDHYQQSMKQINEKLQYSEQLLINITPSKNMIIDEQYLSTTVKKENLQFSSPSQGKFYQRGLKKLAFEAFNFVSHQKKTTYKQVAKKLINQINDQNELDIQRKGQMNIKRRVYDALNVLIALGLLKRNGNKIIGKKLSNDYFSLEAEVEKEKMKKKQQGLLQELDHVNRQYNKKTQSINKKRKMAEQISQKINILKELTRRNRVQKSNYPQSIHRNKQITCKNSNRIEMPFICLTLNQNEKKQQFMDIEHEKTNNVLVFSQQYKQILLCKYQFARQVSIIGDTDLLKNMPLHHTFPACLSEGNNQRAKKIKHR